MLRTGSSARGASTRSVLSDTSVGGRPCWLWKRKERVACVDLSRKKGQGAPGIHRCLTPMLAIRPLLGGGQHRVKEQAPCELPLSAKSSTCEPGIQPRAEGVHGLAQVDRTFAESGPELFHSHVEEERPVRAV